MPWLRTLPVPLIVPLLVRVAPVPIVSVPVLFNIVPLLPIINEPALTVVPPVWVRFPLIVRLPVPFLVKLPVPEMSPSKVLLAVLLTVRAFAPNSTEEPSSPVRLWSVAPVVTAEMSNTPPIKFNPLDVAMEPEPDRARVPALTVIEPVSVLAAVRVRIPSPCFWKPPMPEMTPERVALFPAVLKMAALGKLTALATLKSPVKPSVVANLMVSVPVPSAEL